MPRSEAENPKRIIAIKLIWIPGINPLMVPARIPMIKAIMSSMIIFTLFILGFNNSGLK